MKVRFREPYRARQINFRGYLLDIPASGDLIVGDDVGRELCLNLFAYKLVESKPILVDLLKREVSVSEESKKPDDKSKRKGRKFD